MSKNYEPENQFLERLEWQLASEYRRTDRLKSAPGKVTMSRKMVAISVLVGTLMTGVAMIKAAEVIKDSWRKKIEIARIETEVKLKEAKLASTREITSRIEIQFSNGLLQEEEYLGMQVALEKAELELQKSQLNLEEVNASGKTPRTELYAPVVRGRDFVSERLMFEIKDVDLDLGLYKSYLVKVKQRIEVGIIHENELDAIQSEIDAKNVTIDSIKKKLDLRSRFVAGEITAQEIEIEDRMAVAEKNFHMAQAKVEFLNKVIIELEDSVAVGMVPQIELTQMRYVLNAAQAELDLATLEIDVLEKIK
ncbi:MAG: hypothetical protein MUP98_18285 [Candidatus Aminicenantes bacterium]|nr:hypothetical protein [Candidatus Aminicenantes bacterium]